MRRTERKKIETVKSGNQIFGHIKLRISRILQLERTRNSYKKW